MALDPPSGMEMENSLAASTAPKRPRTGTVDPFTRPDGSIYYRGRIRLGDGTLHRLAIEEPFCNVKADARAYTATIQAEEDAHGRILARKRGEPPPVILPPETVREWHMRWLASRVACGHTSTRDDKSRYLTHVDPLVGSRPMAEAIKRGNSRACAARFVGVGVSTLYGWMAANPEFRERVRAADAQAEQQVVSALFSLATDKTRPHFEAIKFWLKTRRAKTWRELQPLPAKEPDTDLSGKSEEELVAEVEAWLAQRRRRPSRRERA